MEAVNTFIPSRNVKRNWWITSTIVLFLLFVVAALLLVVSLQNQKVMKLSFDQMVDAYKALQSKNLLNTGENNKYVIHDSDSFSPEVFYAVDPKTFDTTLYIKGAITQQKDQKVLELKENHAGFERVWWSPGISGKSPRFIVRAILGDSSTYFLVNTDGAPAKEIKFSDNSYNSFNTIINWIDDERILGRYTLNKNDGSLVTYSYWIAPVSDLSKKKTILVN